MILTILSINSYSCSSDQLIDHLENEQYETFEQAQEMMVYIKDCFEQRHSLLALFPLVYISTTTAIKDKIETSGFYQNPIWIRAAITEFFKFYRSAIINFEKKKFKNVPRSWLTAFKYSLKKNASPFKSLLLSMHAHINRDLPIALNNIGSDLSSCTSCKKDFFRTNIMFEELLPSLWEDLFYFSPESNKTHYAVDHYTKDIMKALRFYRKRAWKLALKMQRPKFKYSKRKIDHKANRLTPFLLMAPRHFNHVAVFLLKSLF